MKSKRLLSCVLALVMVLGMAALPASAATTFPDIQTHWAKSYIEEMTDANMFKGYEDGTFKPENKLTTAEALALCARAVGLDDKTAVQIAADRKEELDEVLDGAQSWFYKEFAICLETGILSYSDFKSLFQSGALLKPVYKEDLAVYLIRAMQLGPMAERISSYSLNFTDTAAISASAKPYVYLLVTYGVVQGDENNAFTPRIEVSRAIMATMLSRAIHFMENNGVNVDLPEYTSYEFRQGTIAAVSPGTSGVLLVSLNNDLTGTIDVAVSLPDDITVYANNMKSSTGELIAGRHIRICMDSKGTPAYVRVSDALEVVQGSVNGVNGNNVAITVDGLGRIVTMDRFTQVQVGSRSVGDRSIVDPSAGYTGATCKVDDQGRLVAIQFTGGTRQEEGIFSSVTKPSGTSTTNTIRVIGFDGVGRSFSMPAAGIVTINGVTGTLNNSYEGNHVSMRVSNDDNTIASLALDTVTQYVQGGVKSVSYASDTNTITITNLNTSKSTTYNLDKNCVITYNGAETLLKNIQKDYFVTARLSGKNVVRIDTFPGSTVTAGTITERGFGTGSEASVVTIEVTQEDDTVASFKLNLADPPTVIRNDETSSIDKLRVGDEVEVTVRYNAVTRVVAKSQSANVIATIDSVLKTTSGYTLNLTLATTGEEVSYPVASGLSITQNGKEIDLKDLDAGYQVGLVLSGDQITAIEVLQAANTANKVSGTVLFVNSTGNKYILLKVRSGSGSEEPVTVNIASGTSILDASTGKSVYLKDLVEGDSLEITGSYEGSTFNATIVIRN